MPIRDPLRPSKSLSTALALTLLLAVAGCTASRTAPDDEAWISLLAEPSRWTPKIRGHAPDENFGETFRWQDGLLKVRYGAYASFDERFGHIFYDTPYSHYRLRVEYRFVGEQAPGGPGWAVRNSGIMMHGQPAESMLPEQDFPISIEVQLLGGTGEGERTTANLCTPGTHIVMDSALVTQHCTSSTSQTYHGDRWVAVEVLVLGDSLIRHFVEGEPVLEYAKPQLGGGVVNGYDPAFKQDGAPLTAGSISLQSESHPIDFRRVDLLNLKGCMDPRALNYKSYYVAPDASACQY